MIGSIVTLLLTNGIKYMLKKSGKRVSEGNKKKIIAWLMHRQGQLKLHDWVARISFVKELAGDNFCEVAIDVDYLRYELFISEPQMADSIRDGEVQDIKRYLTHELVHVILEPLNTHLNQYRSDSNKELLDRSLENTVQRITRLLCN